MMIFPLVVFFLVVISIIICMNVKIEIPLPFLPYKDHSGRITSRKFHLKSVYPPLIGIVALFIGGAMTLKQIYEGGIKGDQNIQPYAIMLLFIPLAYVCVSLDSTGALSYISLRVVRSIGSSRIRLFFSFYILSALMASFSSNDIVILTLTPMVAYCSKYAECSPWPFLFAMYTAANLSSIFFETGNATNIIVAEAFQISFGNYFVHMAFLSMVTSLLGSIILFIIFRKKIQGSFTPPTFDPESTLIDPRGGIVHAIILSLCLIGMGITSFLP